MMIFRKAIPRRTFLTGMGATIALPLLDGMLPAFASALDASAKSPVRLGTVYIGNGMWPMDKFTPQAEGTAFELTPTLAPLAPFREQLLVVSGLAQKEAMAAPGEGSEDHSRACATFLTGVRVKPTGGKDYRNAISMDQFAAKELGKHTQLASLEVTLAPERVGKCETACVYTETLSWRTPTTPLPMERDPRAIFQRMFGDSDSTDRAARLSLIREERSILDGLASSWASFVKEIGPSDRAKLTEYLDAVRDIERRIQLAEEQSNREVPTLERPTGVPSSFEEYAKLMIDLQVLAFQTDLTRVITFMMIPEGNSRAYPELGIADQHHPLSHHQNNPVAIEKLLKINIYHMKLFAYYLEKLRATPDGDGSLLDHSIFLYGGGLSNGNLHLHENLPLLLVGGGAGLIKGGRHIRYPDRTPMTNVYVTVLDKLGLPVEQLGDSNGKIEPLSV